MGAERRGGLLRWRPMVERSMAWLVAIGHRRVRYRGVARNQLGLSLRVAAVTCAGWSPWDLCTPRPAGRSADKAGEGGPGGVKEGRLIWP
jgi:hypothetical protein